MQLLQIIILRENDLDLFQDGKIKLSNKKNNKELLIKIANAIYNLSYSKVFTHRILIGGEYHKNYYNYICSGFFNEKNIVFIQKNALKSEFLYNLKHNMCNYGFYFYKENNNLFLQIYSGNSFLLERTQQNFVETYFNKNEIFENENIKFKTSLNYYEQDYLKNLSPFNFKIVCKNEYLKKQIEKFNLNKNSNYTIVIENDLSYKIFYENIEIDKDYLFSTFKKFNLSDDEMIIKINLRKLKRVVNSKSLIYNDLTNYFDIYKTLKYLSWRITNDKNNAKLV